MEEDTIHDSDDASDSSSTDDSTDYQPWVLKKGHKCRAVDWHFVF